MAKDRYCYVMEWCFVKQMVRNFVVKVNVMQFDKVGFKYVWCGMVLVSLVVYLWINCNIVWCIIFFYIWQD